MFVGPLGYKPWEFWELSYGEMMAALSGYQQRQKETYRHTGHLMAQMRNLMGGDHGRAVRPEDIFPFLRDENDKGNFAWSVGGYEEVEVETDDG